MRQKHHIIVGLSGGVDSAVAALLLKKAGHHVEGIFMKNWEEDDTDTFCSAATDKKDAELICEQLQIPFSSVNFSAEYRAHVFAEFLAAFRAGLTPNPDILCNREIKFRAFLDYARTRGADFIATGHYARLHKTPESLQLLKAIDLQKDQSYFLYALSQSQLQNTIFPLGGLHKKTVREIARYAGLINHAKKDSTGICFIGERNFKQFLTHYLEEAHGDIETPEGNVIGRHDGLMFYTNGQRRGLGIGGCKTTDGSPWYVVGRDTARNVLIVAQGKEHPLLYATSLIARHLHWIQGKPPELPATFMAKTRYRQADQACMMQTVDDDTIRVEFTQPQRALTPGQSIVFYQGEICLGGGIITSDTK